MKKRSLLKGKRCFIKYPNEKKIKERESRNVKAGSVNKNNHEKNNL